MKFKDDFLTISIWIAWQVENKTHHKSIIDHITSIRTKESISIHCTFKRTILQNGTTLFDELLVELICVLHFFFSNCSSNRTQDVGTLLKKNRKSYSELLLRTIFKPCFRVRSLLCIKFIFMQPNTHCAEGRLMYSLQRISKYNLLFLHSYKISFFYGLLSLKSKITFSSFNMHRRMKLNSLTKTRSASFFRQPRIIWCFNVSF